MFALIKFDNGGLAIYPKKVVKNCKDYVIVKDKGCCYNASLITEHGNLDLLKSIKQDIEKKNLYILLHVDQHVEGYTSTSSQMDKDDNIKLLKNVEEKVNNEKFCAAPLLEENLLENIPLSSLHQTIGCDNSNTYATPIRERFALPDDLGSISSGPASDALLFPKSPYSLATGQEDILTCTANCNTVSSCTGKSAKRRLFECTSVTHTTDDIELLENAEAHVETEKFCAPSILEEIVSENIPLSSIDQTLGSDNSSTCATPVRKGCALPRDSAFMSSICSTPASDVLFPESPHIFATDQADILTSTVDFSAISICTEESAGRRLCEGTSVAHTIVDESSLLNQTSTSSAGDIPKSKQKTKHVQRQKKPCKQHSCYFCGLLFTNLRKHWRRKHADQPIFQKALKNIGSKKNHREFEHLRKMGDEKFNNSSDGTHFITVRDSSSKTKSNYLLCEECRGYYVSDNYARHRKLYCSRTAEFGHGLLGKARVATSRISEEAHPLLVQEIFPYLTKEKQRNVILNDPAAIIMGNILSEEQLSKPDPSDLYKYVSNQLRLLADLFNIANSLDPEITEIDDLFYTHRYETVIKAVKTRGQFVHGVYKTPYPARESCTILSKLCRKLKSIALSMNNDNDYKRYDRFETMLKEQQNTNVTKLAAAARIAHRRKKVDVLPSTSEVNALFKTLQQECINSLEEAKNNLTTQSYGRLAKAIVARIMVLNRRRPGDVHRTTLDEYNNLTRAVREFLNNLSDRSEREMAANLCRYITKGKLNRNIANLITADMVEAIDFLIAHRVEVGISENNRYVFANPKAKRALFFRADDALKSICYQFGLPYDRLSATKLRKHFATTTANMDQNTQMVISDFMGHSYNIHQNIYQIRQVQTDVSVVGRILFDASGIYCTDKPLTTPITAENVTSSSSKPSWLDDGCDSDACDDPNNEEFEVSSAVSKCHTSAGNSNKESQSEKEYRTNLSESSKSSAEYKKNTAANASTKHIHKRKKNYKLPFPIDSYRMANFRAPFTSRTWRTPDKKNARIVFQEYIENADVPTLSEIQEILAKQPVTVSKRVSQVQSWIRAEIQRNRREKGGHMKERWTTPQKMELRRHFHEYYKTTKETGKMTYPPSDELQKAVQNIAELKNKTPTLIRSKLQNEYKNLSAIQVFSETSEDDSEELESEDQC